ncbi:tetratricopeptide repeat protein [Rhodoferax sp. PAMC 29310]|uniref:tetratricopeptide repeat protein n=1 Tax=Rhodoferax sp. PAMC 29310 TaxID=2822760 RepID=UPI001B32FFE4|nr:tetratricopeptide repeat protein [Rhodoferax sp. PAMC 29310]
MYSSNQLRRLFACAVALFSLALTGQRLHAQENSSNCGSIQNHYGPFDYRTQRDQLEVVERYHFTPVIAALIQIRGNTNLSQDIAYTLHTSPNHHRALMALVRLGERMKTPQPVGLVRPIECYFDRAIRFAPDDTLVRVLYSQFLTKQSRKVEAIGQLDTAVVVAKDNGFSHFNIGLAFFDMGEYEKALKQAHKAAELGFNREELADQLRGANKWQDPVK